MVVVCWPISVVSGGTFDPGIIKMSQEAASFQFSLTKEAEAAIQTLLPKGYSLQPIRVYRTRSDPILRERNGIPLLLFDSKAHLNTPAVSTPHQQSLNDRVVQRNQDMLSKLQAHSAYAYLRKAIFDRPYLIVVAMDLPTIYARRNASQYVSETDLRNDIFRFLMNVYKVYAPETVMFHHALSFYRDCFTANNELGYPPGAIFQKTRNIKPLKTTEDNSNSRDDYDYDSAFFTQAKPKELQGNLGFLLKKFVIRSRPVKCCPNSGAHLLNPLPRSYNYQNLVDRIYALSPTDLKGIVRILERQKQPLIGPDGVIEVDITTLEAKTIRELENYLSVRLDSKGTLAAMSAVDYSEENDISLTSAHVF